MAGAGVGGVLIGVLLLLTVFDGGGEPEVVGTPAGIAAPVEAAPSVPATSPREVQLPSAPANGRDPFRQLVTVPKAAGPAQGPAPAQAVAQSPNASTQPARPPPAGASGRASLELKAIAPDAAGVVRANIMVDGQSYSPANGDLFSYGVRLERIDGDCVEVSAQDARARMCLPAAKP